MPSASLRAVTHSLRQTLKSLNQYQDPSKSFGYLRDAMAEIDGECIPFMCVSPLALSASL